MAQGRSLFRLLFPTVLLPLAVLGFGLWQASRARSDLLDAEVSWTRLAGTVAQMEAVALDPSRAMRLQFRRDGKLYGGPMAVSEAQEELAGLSRAVWVMGWRPVLPPVVAGTAGAAAALSVLVLAVATVLGRRGRASRAALLSGFGTVRRVLPGVLVVQIVLAAVGFLAVVAFEGSALVLVGNLSAGTVKLFAIVGGVVVACLYAAVSALVQLRRTAEVFAPDPLPVLGRTVSRAEAPGLWAMMDGLAARLGALVPDTVVVGLPDGFYVSSGEKRLEPGGLRLSGRTLYVPLPLLALLPREETAAIIGHELAHFSGGDTEYSLRFVPIYAGVARSLDAVAASGTGSGALLATPALRLGVFVMDQFHHAVRHWSRVREYAADAAGAGAVSERAAALALLRVSAIGPRVAAVLDRTAEQPDAAPPDLVAAVVSLARAEGLATPSLEEEQPHPTDTHPPTAQRIAALHQVADAALLAEAAVLPAKGPEPLDTFLADPGAVCRAVSADFTALMQERHRDHRTWLEERAAEVEPAELVLHDHTRVSVILFCILGALMLVPAGILAVLAARAPDPAVPWAAAAGAVAISAGFAGFGVFVGRRSRFPTLILRPDSMEVPGLSPAIAWADIADLDMTLDNGTMRTRVLLSPGAAFPVRVPGGRRAGLDPRRRIVTLGFGLPKGMKAQGFADLLARYRMAQAARAALAGPTGKDPA